MKKLIMIIGTNGIGKSTVSVEIMHFLPYSAYIDNDVYRNGAGNGKMLD